MTSTVLPFRSSSHDTSLKYLLLFPVLLLVFGLLALLVYIRKGRKAALVSRRNRVVGCHVWQNPEVRVHVRACPSHLYPGEHTPAFR